MESKSKPSRTLRRSYEEFQPSVDWKSEEGQDTIVIPLPGFKKDHLDVEVNFLGKLKIKGERPLDDENRWSRFSKDFRIPKDCNADEIHGNFAGEVLYVTMPKKLTQSSAQVERKNFEFRLGGSVFRVNQRVGVLLSGAVAIALLVGLGIYATRLFFLV